MFKKLKAFLHSLFARKKSKDIAARRLTEVLACDRAQQSAQFVARIREEISAILKKYADFSAADLVLQINRSTENVPCLFASVPIHGFHEPAVP